MSAKRLCVSESAYRLTHHKPNTQNTVVWFKPFDGIIFTLSFPYFRNFLYL